MLTSEKSAGPPALAGRRGIRGLAPAILVVLVTLLLTSCSIVTRDSAPSRDGMVHFDPTLGLFEPISTWYRYENWYDRPPERGPLPLPTVVRFRSPIFASLDDHSSSRTYRLTIAIDGPTIDRTWMLILPIDGEGARATVNGKLYPISKRILSFESPGPVLDILVMVPAGSRGIDSTRLSPDLVMFGEASAVGVFLAVAGGISFLLVGYFAFGALFILFLFNLWTKNREFLSFAVVLAVEALRYLINARALLPDVPLPLDPDLVHSIAFMAHFAAVAWFLTSIIQEKQTLPRKLVLLPFPFAVAAEFLLPDKLFTIHSIILVYYAAACVAAFVILLIKALRGSKRALWLHPSPLFLIATIPLRLFLSDDPLVAFLVEPVATLLFTLAAMLGLLRKIHYSFQTTESLNDYVADMGRSVKRFIPTEFLQALGKRDVVDLRLGDHVKKEMTIFFSDIRAFTELSEKLTVEENFAFVNSYLSRMVPIIRDNGGFVDKYIGDAIMALFPDGGGPDGAIRTAIEMQTRMNEYNGHRAKSGYRSIQMGVGIHSGSLMLGVVGVDDRMENTVISDAVNLASRLQAITKAFNASIAISEEVFKNIRDPGAYTYRFIGKVKVKGKVDPISVFEIFDGVDKEIFERKIKANTFFEQGMMAYYQKDFAGSIYYFRRVLEILPEDGAAAFYLETCMNRKQL